VYGITYSSGGTPRIKTSAGYITANQKYVIKAVSNYGSYLQARPAMIGTKKASVIYKDTAFTKKVSTAKKGTTFTARDIIYSKTGIPRIKVTGGYITSNKSNVLALRSDYRNYVLVNSGYIKAKKNTNIYTTPGFQKKKMAVRKGTKIKVTGLDWAGATPRLKVSGGFISANKTIVAKSK
jgi:hypothetical protein